MMTIARGLAAGAMFAGLALGLAAPAFGDPLNGHYIETETYPDGHQINSDWYFTPCGDGCSDIGHLGQAHLVDGRWTLDGHGGVSCEQGGDIPKAIHFVYSWDPNSLAGTVQITNNVDACGNKQGYQETNQLQLAPAP
jgi:hypothetical protein